MRPRTCDFGWRQDIAQAMQFASIPTKPHFFNRASFKMAKPKGYDSLTKDRKWELCLALLQSAHGQRLLDRAFDMAGEELRKKRRLFFDEPPSSEVLLFRMAVTRQALEVALVELTTSAEPNWLDIQDLEILYEGLGIQIDILSAEENEAGN
jgi:hypothetical protein